MRRQYCMLLIICFCMTQAGCYAVRPSAGGGSLSELGTRKITPPDIALPDGYRIEAVASGFTFPTGVTFDDQGVPYVVEAGYSYGEVWSVPRLLRVEPDRKTVIAEGTRNGPWTGVARYRGAFYVAEGGELAGGRILRITDGGEVTPIVKNLPTRGDHHTNGPAVGPDGKLYFGTGTATNSGIVGEDNFKFGWLKRYPAFHDAPCRDVVLTGENFTGKNVLNPDGGEVETGAFSPYGTATVAGQVIKGRIPCSGAVLRVAPEGGPVELVAWGFRNPFGLAFSPDNKLYVTNNGFDERGSRPVYGAGDELWEVREGTWYGWPDFGEGRRLDEGSQFRQLLKKKPRLLMAQYPNPPPRPVAVFSVHASADGFDFSNNELFGHKGEAFIALFGDQSPTTGKLLGPAGFKIVRVDPVSGAINEFAVNKGKKTGPASGLGTGGLERPVAARFDPSGLALYIVDFGILKETKTGAQPVEKTGVLWRITRNKQPR